MRTKEKHMNIMLFIIIVVVFICFIGYFCSNEILSQDNKTAYADIAMTKTVDEYSMPNDPYFSMQWALTDKNNGISIQQAWGGGSYRDKSCRGGSSRILVSLYKDY